MRTALVLLGAVTVLVFAGSHGTAAPVPKHLIKEPEGEKAKLQGLWKVEAIKMGGNDILAGLGQNFDMTIEVRGDVLTATVSLAGTFRKTTATIKHEGDAGTKRFTTSETQTVDKDGKPVNGGGEKDEAFAYAFDGDKLVLASKGSGGKDKLPADPLKPGPQDVIMIWARVK